MRSKKAIWLVGVACVSCVHRAPAVPRVAGEAVDTIWYVSARSRADGRPTLRLADSLEFGLVAATRSRTPNPLTEAVRITIRDSTRLTRSEFVASLRARAMASDSATPVAVLYVHGIGTWQQEALVHGANAYARTQSRSPWVVFNWPSKGSGVSAPRAGAILSSAYWDDSTAAAASHPAFASAMHTVFDAVGSRHTMLVAHSMGAQLTTETLLTDEGVRRRLADEPVRALALFAADVNTARFGDVIVPAIRLLVKRQLLYASSNDRLLALSRRINKSDRAGLLRRPVDSAVVRPDVELVDVTRGLAALNWFRRSFGTHHSLSRASGALFDLMQIVARELPAECRSILGTAQMVAPGYWSLTQLPPPPPGALAACANR